MRRSQVALALLALALVVGIAARTWFLLHPAVVSAGEPDVYQADEGVVGLMAKHILEGRSLPVFFAGQQYLGALEAYLVAASAAVLPASMIAVRVVPYLFSLALIPLVWWATRPLFGRAAAALAAALVALPSPYLLEWGLKARGGFIEHVVLSVLLVGLFARLAYARRRDWGTRLALGLVAGLAAWVNQLVGTTLAVTAAVLWRRRGFDRGLAIAGVGFVLGAAPLLVHVARDPSAMPSALGHKFFMLNRVEGPERYGDQRTVRGLAERVEALADGPRNLGVLLGAASPSLPQTTAGRLLGLVPLALFALGAAHCLRRIRTCGWTGPHGLVVLLGAGVLAIGYHSARYLLVGYPLAAMMAGAWWAATTGAARPWAVALAVAALVVNGFGVVARAQAEAPDHGPLLAALERVGCTRGYSAGPLYHLVFETGEEIVLAPLQKDRFPAYDGIVAAASDPCYVYRADQAEKRHHEQFLAGLQVAGVSWRELGVPPYTVLHGFTPRARLTPELVAQARERGPRATWSRGLEQGPRATWSRGVEGR
jgi:hypothetical protein